MRASELVKTTKEKLKRILNSCCTMDIGIFALTESINEKSISATTIPVDSRSETQTNVNNLCLIFNEYT